MVAALRSRVCARSVGATLAVLLLGATVAFGQGAPGGPGGRGGGFGGGATPPGPAAEVPDVVKMARPSDAEVAQVRASIAKIDLLKKYPDLVQVNVPVPMSANTAIRPSLSNGFAQKHADNLEVAKKG